ncbi:MAG: hypothetical protein IJM46_04255 [Oscillospiraceae bacterium]|nr:hypothetical protein [Oscillospiraceae bacterium]
MKQFRHLISVLFAAMITLCFSITAFADDKKYDIDFTREEAYAAVMNTTPTQARWLYGGKEAYFEAIPQDDKEKLFDMIWNLTENGILYDTMHTVHIDSFTDDYFGAIIHAFSEADSEEEGLSNLRTRINEINEEYFSEDSPEHEKVEIVEKEEPDETLLSKPDVTTAAITMEETQPPTTLYTTTAPRSESKKSSHTVLIVILCLFAVGAAAGIGYYVLQTKKTK